MKRLFPKFDSFEEIGRHLQRKLFGDNIKENVYIKAEPRYTKVTARNPVGASGGYTGSWNSNVISRTSATYTWREPDPVRVHPEIVQIDRDEATRTYSIKYRLQEFPNTIYTVKITDEAIVRQVGSLSQDNVLSAMEHLVWTEVSKVGRLVQG